jgi:hypothetical protein
MSFIAIREILKVNASGIERLLYSVIRSWVEQFFFLVFRKPSLD